MAPPALLITGGSGYLGSRLTALAIQSQAWSVHATYLSRPAAAHFSHQLDLRNQAETAALIDAVRPSVIIHQAVSPRAPADIAAIVPAALHVTAAAQQVGAHVIFVSTDMVFDGARPPYMEESSPAPTNDYASAKVRAEAVVAEGAPVSSLIVRPSLIYGFDPIDKQTAWLLEGIRTKQSVRLFVNEIRCPIWVDSTALALLELATCRAVGRLNLGGPALNRWDIGMKLLACLGLQAGPAVTPALSTSEQRRPTNLTLDTRRARALLATPILSIDEAWEAHRLTQKVGSPR